MQENKVKTHTSVKNQKFSCLCLCLDFRGVLTIFPFLVFLGGVESNSGIFRGGESFLFTFRGVMMKLT